MSFPRAPQSSRFIDHGSFPAGHREAHRELEVPCLCSPPQIPQIPVSTAVASCRYWSSCGRKASRCGRAGRQNDNGEWLHSPHSCPKLPSHRALPTKIPTGEEFLGGSQAGGNELCLGSRCFCSWRPKQLAPTLFFARCRTSLELCFFLFFFFTRR